MLSKLCFYRRRVRALREDLDSAVRTLQPMIRGLLARAAARREKEALSQVRHFFFARRCRRPSP